LSTPEEILKKYWGYDQFRELQGDIVRAVLAGKDTLALLPTGGGKSICYQVPGLVMEGITLVVSPLIALMQDQVSQLRKRTVSAIAIHSGMSKSEIDVALDNCVYGKVKFLYLSPERLKTELFIERFKKMKVALIAIDEAHCISQWGYDFRPPYLEIAALREVNAKVQFLALTATATKQVKGDIIEKLALRSPSVFQKSFTRDNLSFVVRITENKERKLLEILRNVRGSAIVYVRSRKGTVDLSKWLTREKIQATFYHAGLPHEDRMKRQNDWISNQVRVMVATNAFGMGIDKPDVRVVIHMDLPENLEAYYQEAGRAGRDGNKAYAALVFHEVDVLALRSKVQQGYPSVEYMKKVYQALANFYQLATGSAEGESFEFDLDNFCQRFGMKPSAVFPALKKLEEEGLIQLSESFYRPSRVHVHMDKARLYEFQVANSLMDPVIKSLLRLYGAEVFSDFVAISESNIARNLKISEKEVKLLLVQLEKRQVLDYAQATDKPALTFLLPRQDAAKLPLNLERLASRRELAFSKMEAMIEYGQQTHRCRMQVMLAYFDEHTDAQCGKCDVCIERKKKDNKTLFQDYEKGITKAIQEKPMTVDELETAMSPRDHHLFVEVVRDLVDQEVLCYDAYWVLRIK
jgi:ATP-dependent DNA helicase RecQ